MSLDKYFSGILDFFGNGWVFLKNLLYPLVIFLNIDVNLSYGLFWLLMIDSLLGIIKSVVIKELSFSFKSFYIGLLVKFSLLLLPLTVSLMGMSLGYDLLWVTDSSLKLIIIHEGISIMTNLLSIRRGENIQNKDYVATLIEIIRNLLIKIHKKL